MIKIKIKIGVSLMTKKIKTTINKYILAGAYLSGSEYFEEFATTQERAEALKEIKAAYAEFNSHPYNKAHKDYIVNPHGLIVGHELIIK